MDNPFAPIYEIGEQPLNWWSAGFSDDLYNNYIYTPIGLTLFISCIIWMLVYYYIIDHPRFAQWYHWLLWLGLTSLINFGIGYYIAFNELDIIYGSRNIPLPYSIEFYNLAIINAIWAFLFSGIFSFCIKWKSVMCRNTPF